MTPAESYKCYDSKSNCAEVAEWRGGCHKHGDSCRKVTKYNLRKKSYFLTVNCHYVQSCGRCEGSTPHSSNSECYDEAENCSKVLKWKNGCQRNGDSCKKVRHL